MSRKRKLLGVNIDHVATLREARKTNYPDPVFAAQECLSAGADSIVSHLREDRRHIKDHDVFRIKKEIYKKFNLEMSIHPSVVKVALQVRPNQATIVPERRRELTTEGGLDVIGLGSRLERVVKKLQKAGVEVSLFIEPDKDQIKAARDIGVGIIEIHTGHYADAKTKRERLSHLRKIIKASEFAYHKLGLVVNAGHGLHYDNVQDIVKIPEIQELNIGHSIISYAVLFGLRKAVKDMLNLLRYPE